MSRNAKLIIAAIVAVAFLAPITFRSGVTNIAETIKVVIQDIGSIFSGFNFH
jgi:hypothetical protein